MKANNKLREVILKYALQNAIFYKGKANPSAVLGKVMSQNHDARANIAETRTLIDNVVKEVNHMHLDEQRKKLEELAPELLEKQEKKQEGLAALEDAVEGHVVTRFAPSPTGPLSIGQFMRAVFLSYYYAKRYRGKFILRIEDTDTKKLDPGAYDWLREDLERMDTKWDEFCMQSDRIPVYYKHARYLIEKGRAYVCTCATEDFRKQKLEESECACRHRTPAKNMELWESMVNGGMEDGSAALRLKTNMSDPNPVLRDPPIFRISKTPHPLKGTRYSAWPLYNFSCAIDDHELGVTHVFRGKEHEHNTAVQKTIADMLGWKFTNVVNFGMIRFPEGAVHTRDIKTMIANGDVTGWDDPKLPTIRALLRRGFRPDAIKSLAMQCGLSKNDIELGWENLDAHNRKLIDPLANRYMVVIDPINIAPGGMPEKREVFEALHPDFPERGKKKIPLNHKSIHIAKDDYEKFKGSVIRLKGLCNVSLVKTAKCVGDEIMKDMQKIQWVSEPHVKVRVVTKEGVLHGIGEPEMAKLKVDDMIQMERVGFGRVDANDGKEITIYFAHK